VPAGFKDGQLLPAPSAGGALDEEYNLDFLGQAGQGARTTNVLQNVM